MPVKKTTKTTKKTEETNTVKTVIRVLFPQSISTVSIFSNISFDELEKKYATARSTDKVISVTVGLNKENGIAYQSEEVTKFDPVMFPAVYIQSIRGIEHEK